jgi:hypothetical protein
MSKAKAVYISCPKEKSQPTKNLLHCLANCKDRCRAFYELEDKKILSVIKSDEGKHELKYDQLKLFAMPEKRKTRKN